jgi:hypothetical protein
VVDVPRITSRRSHVVEVSTGGHYSSRCSLNFDDRLQFLILLLLMVSHADILLLEDRQHIRQRVTLLS